MNLEYKMGCADVLEVAQNLVNTKDIEYQQFLYKNTFYLIDKKKLDFTLSILKTNKKTFFEIDNLRSFFEEYELLSEEFLEFISINKKEMNI